MDISVQRSVQSSRISVERWIDQDNDDCSLLGMLGMRNPDVIERLSDHTSTYLVSLEQAPGGHH